MRTEVEELKVMVTRDVESQKRLLIRLSRDIHDNPELGFHEEKASTWLCDYLQGKGFCVERGTAGLSTAFRAVYGEGGPRIALLAEYDALPEMGHACGHNLISAASVGAGVASKHVVDRFGGSIVVLGTPAEEAFGGKISMVNDGIFRGIDVAMMVHPDTRNALTMQALACVSLDVEFWGKAAHAAVCPFHGINALEALLLSFNSINSLRQHVQEGSQIHGVITSGGEAPNVVPAYSAGKFMIRARNSSCLEELKERVLNCFLGASQATGARLEYNFGDKVYAPMKNNLTLAELFRRNLESLGRHVESSDSPFAGSTDMGNVSQLVPSIHPLVAIAPPEVSLHTPEFARAADSEEGYRGLKDAAMAMAMTVADIFGDPETLREIKREFSESG